MHSTKELELHAEAVKVTWCGCARCCAMGPRFMKLVNDQRELTVELSSHCCDSHADYETVSYEKQRFAGRSTARIQTLR